MNVKIPTWFWLSCLFFILFAGITPLYAGNLQPSAPPGSTMKTLDEIPPTWSQKLPASDRWVQVLNGFAVLDKETGLVWEKAPEITEKVDWASAFHICLQKRTGGRMGWRLPSAVEMASLVDDEFAIPPQGAPFTIDDYPSFWTSSTYASDESKAYSVAVRIRPFFATQAKYTTAVVWCVRGGL